MCGTVILRSFHVSFTESAVSASRILIIIIINIYLGRAPGELALRVSTARFTTYAYTLRPTPLKSQRSNFLRSTCQQETASLVYLFIYFRIAVLTAHFRLLSPLWSDTYLTKQNSKPPLWNKI